LAEAGRTTDSGQRAGGLSADVSELWGLVVAYVQQETIDPIKQLGRYLVYGVAGAVCFSIGALLVALGGLRAIQFETYPHLSGNLSWIPYLFIVVVGVAAVALMIGRLTRSPSRGER
jgi:hypothetical protein